MKKFISGLLVGLLLTTTVFASSEQIQAVFADFNFVINGKVQNVQTKPLVYNNTSYLPVRDIANLLGYDVDYKADTRTIELNNTKEVNQMSNEWISARELAAVNDLQMWQGDYLTIEKGNVTISIEVAQMKEGHIVKIKDSNNPQIELSVKLDNGTTFFLIQELKNLKILD